MDVHGVFRERCESIIKQPDNFNSDNLDFITKTFQVLKSYGTLQAQNLNLSEERKININELTPADIKVFTHCAKKYFRSHQLDADKAESTIQNLNECIIYLNKNRQFDVAGRPGNEALIEIQKATQQILIHKKIDHKEISSPISSQAMDSLTEVLRDEQVTAQSRESRLRRMEKRNNRLTIAAFTLVGTGSITAITGAFTSLALGPIGMILAAVGIGIMLAALIPYGLRKSTDQEEKEYHASIHKLEQLEEFRKISITPDFIDFAEKNGFKEITEIENRKDRNDKVVLFFDYYKKQKKLDSDLDTVKSVEIKADTPLPEKVQQILNMAANNPILASFQSQINAIEKLKAKLGLKK